MKAFEESVLPMYADAAVRQIAMEYAEKMGLSIDWNDHI
jgi:hypothetical protein